MALIEQRVLRQVAVFPAEGIVNVQWADQIVRSESGEVVSEQFHRRAYTLEQKDDFIAEVEGAEQYVQAAGWNVASL